MQDTSIRDDELAGLIALLKGLRRNSLWAVHQWVTAMSVDIPAALILNPPLKPGEPPEAACFSGIDLRKGDNFSRPRR